MKLRVFDYKTNKMFKVLNICFEGTPTVTIQYNPVIKFRADFSSIMLSSELFDKNNNEIYDRDIVKWGDDFYLVKYEKGCFWLTSNTNTIPLNVESQSINYSEEIIYQQSNIVSFLEVVGNQHENPYFFEKTENNTYYEF